MFDRWCTATKTTDFSSLRELVLLEEFKNSVSERIVTYLNEQKVVSLSQAAVLADEFVLTHKPAHVFSTSPTTQFRFLYALGRNGSVFIVMNLAI